LRLWTRAPRTTMLSVDIGSEGCGNPCARPQANLPSGSARLTESFYYKAGRESMSAVMRDESERGVNKIAMNDPIPRPASRKVIAVGKS
jgi:hypothetical protein